MRLNLEINRTVKNPVADDFWRKAARQVLREPLFAFLAEKKINLSVAFVTPAKIRALNKTYRRHDSVTDVLSFPEFKNLAALRKSVDKELFLGELILCYNDIKQYAQQERLNLKQELAKVFAHGLLHLLGLAHGRRMFLLQEKIAKNK